MNKLIELPWLILINWGNHFWNFWLWLNEIWRYYRHWNLFKADLLWMLEYGFKSPFEISRKATDSHQLPEDLTVYGETPWTTLDTIAQKISLTSNDCFIDLGCGTGRNLLFLRNRYRCRVQGYELVPEFVSKFRWLTHKLKLEQAVMHESNWLESTDLEQGSIFFLVGSCYDDQHLKEAENRLQKVPVGSQIISVSYPIRGENIILQEEFMAPFSWGKGTVYIQQRI